MAYCVFCQHDQQALVRCTLRWIQVYTGTADRWKVSFNDLPFQLWFARNKQTRSKDLHKIPYMVLGCYSSSLTATKGKHQLLVHQLLPLSKVSLVADSPWLSSTPSAETLARRPSPSALGLKLIIWKCSLLRIRLTLSETLLGHCFGRSTQLIDRLRLRGFAASRARPCAKTKLRT